MSVVTPKRPVLRWHGGKWRLAPWIITHFPEHRIYVEPFGGAASVLLRKPRSYAEIYNDLDGDVVNLFRVLQDKSGWGELMRLLELTPFARTEFNDSYLTTSDRIENARRMIVRSFMGFGSDGHNKAARTGFRSQSSRSGTTPAHNWANYPSALKLIVKRFAGIVIESRPALQVMAAHDGPDTLHYLDPPYVHATRSEKSRAGGGKYHAYTHEMNDADHVALLEAICGLTGMVVLSGYPHPLYDAALGGWRRVEKKAMADGARERTEVLWINPAAITAMPQGDLLEVVA